MFTSPAGERLQRALFVVQNVCVGAFLGPPPRLLFEAPCLLVEPFGDPSKVFETSLGAG